MTPRLVTPPASMPVSMVDMLTHLHVFHYDDDAYIGGLQAAAVAYLDAYGGVLGRCIMPQTWAVDVTGPGPHLLPFPDATGIDVVADGAAVAFEQALTGCGTVVTAADAAGDAAITITAVYGLPDQRLPAARALVQLIVGGWYQNRESVVIGSSAVELPMAAGALIAALKWRRV